MPHTKVSPEKNLDRGELQDRFQTYVQKVGLRQTKQRTVVLDAVLEMGSHADAESIANKAKELNTGIGLATVYRTLQLLVEADILVERRFDKDRSVYEFADDKHSHHDHLICSECGEIIEFFDQELENLQAEIAKRLGFTLNHHRMELFGKCLSPKTCYRKDS